MTLYVGQNFRKEKPPAPDFRQEMEIFLTSLYQNASVLVMD
jgi:hypothetical protein